MHKACTTVPWPSSWFQCLMRMLASAKSCRLSTAPALPCLVSHSPASSAKACFPRAGCSNLRCLPESLSALPALRQLDLGGCTSLARLPESLGDLGALEWLDLSRCCSLALLPDSTSRLGELAVVWGCLHHFAGPCTSDLVQMSRGVPVSQLVYGTNPLDAAC